MTQSRVSQVSRLFELLCAMERDLGLCAYSDDERRIIYALADLGEIGHAVPSRLIKEHAFCSEISTPTFYRVLKRLTDAGVILVPDGCKTGKYTLSRHLESRRRDPGLPDSDQNRLVCSA